MTTLARFRGCLLGGAIGDALGYPIEFMDWEDIRLEFGEEGLTELITYDKISPTTRR